MAELVDTSVWARRRHVAVRQWFESAAIDGDILMCDMVALEILHSASRHEVYEQVERELEAFPWCHMGDTEWIRARQVYGLLSARGAAWHRSVKHADLLIAACAELNGATLVHYDHDYDAIAAVTGQATRWVAARGSLEH